MGSLQFSVDPEEIADDRFTVYLGVWAEQRIKPGFSVPLYPGAYGLVIAGKGRQVAHWGSGYAMADDALRAFGVERVLHLLPNEKGIRIFTKGLKDHVKFPDGHVRAARHRPGNVTTAKQPYDAFRELDRISRALDDGMWTLEPISKRNEPDGFLKAQHLAATTGREAALRDAPFYSTLAELDPRNHIVATDENPQPFHPVDRAA